MNAQEIQNIINKAVEKTAKETANKIYEKIKSAQEHDRDTIFDRRLYNTKLLLEHYRLFKEHAVNGIFDVSQIECDELNAIEIMDSMLQTAVCKGEIAVESIKNSVLRTKIVIDHVDDMLGIYEQVCYHSGKPEDIRRWDVIYTIFIKDLPEGKSRMELYNDLAEKHFVGERQIRRDVDDAVVRLTALLFGIDGVRNAKVLRGQKVLGDEVQEK